MKKNKKESYLRLQKKRKAHNEKRRKKQRKKNKRIRRFFYKKNKKERKRFLEIFRGYGDNQVFAPKIFSLLRNPEKSIRFIQQIDALWKKKKKVFVVLKKVEEIDHSATTVLLSLMHRFRAANIKFNGDFPSNPMANKIIRESQFFERLESKNPSSKDYTVKRDDQIIGEAGTETIDPNTSLKIRGDVSQTILNSPNYVFQTLHPMFMELMQNTYEHAGEHEGIVHWWLSINHDKAKKTVSFHFIDYGRGIVDSLLKKKNSRIKISFKEKARALFGSNKYSEIIIGLLNGEHSEKYRKEYFRGKGLPSLKKALDNRRIKCLNILTNRVAVDVEKNNALNLSSDFSGTYITWMLDKECEKKIWKTK